MSFNVTMDVITLLNTPGDVFSMILFPGIHFQVLWWQNNAKSGHVPYLAQFVL